MKKLTNHFRALIAIAIMLSVALPSLAYDFEVDGIYYSITDATAKTVEVTYRGSSYDSYTNEYSGSVIIPSSVTYSGTTYFVTSIGEYAFKSCTGLTSVTIPNSVTTIGSSAFSLCTGLTEVTIGNSVTEIGDYAFCYCYDLTSVTIPNSVTSIGDYAFYDCTDLTSVTIPNSVTSIGDYAFCYCTGLTSVAIPNSVSSIGSSSFEYTGWYYNQADGILYLDNCCLGYKGNEPTGALTLNDGTRLISSNAFSGCTGLTSVTIPNSVTYIGSSAFSGCTGLTKVDFNAENCFSMGDYDSPVFRDCPNLKTINIGKDVKSIPKYAFYDCTGLTEFNYNAENCTSFGYSVFSGCPNLKAINIGKDVKSISDMSLYDCESLASVNISDLSAWCKIDFEYSGANPLYYAKKLKLNGNDITNLVIPNDITKIKNYAFYGCTGLKSVIISNTLTSIGVEAFRDCTGLTNVTIGNSVTEIGNNAFYGTPWFESLFNEHDDGLFYLGNILYAYKGTMPMNTSIKIADGTTTIGNSVFSGCSGLTSVTIPNSVTSIGEYAFYNCSGLTEITIPNSVTKIGNKAFDNCSSLRSIVVEDDNMYYDSRNNCNAIIETTSNTLIVGCKNTTIPFSLTKIGEYAFYGCSGLTSITIPNSVTSIGEYAFYNCSGLTQLTIPNSINSISDYTFYGCSALTSITIPNSITSIGKWAFSGCKGLTTLTIPNSVISIGLSPFSSCDNLASVNVESGNKVYDSRDNCNAIIETATNTLISGCKSTIIPNSVTVIGKYAFSWCTSLTSITIPNSISKISYGAFNCCKGLNEISIPNSVTEIGDLVFAYCERLVSITIPNSVSAIGQQVFGGCTGMTEINFNAENCTLMDFNYRISTSIGCLCKTLNIGKDVKNIPYIVFNDFTVSEVNYNAENCKSTNNFLSDFSSIETINIGNNVKSIPNYAFSDCPSTTKVNYNAENCTSIGSSAFSGVKTLNIGNNVSSIPNRAFYDCSSMTDISIGNSVTSIGSDAFTYTGWYNNQANGALYLNNYCLGYKGDAPTENLTIKDNTRFIANNAFEECSGLTSVTIPSSVKYIGASAFYNCGLRVVYSYNMTPPTCADGAFGGDTNSSYSARLMIPEGTYYDYIVADEWYKFDRIQEIAGVETIEADNDAIEVARYDIHGKLISEPTKGVNIVKYSDGTTRKEFVK